MNNIYKTILLDYKDILHRIVEYNKREKEPITEKQISILIGQVTSRYKVFPIANSVSNKWEDHELKNFELGVEQQLVTCGAYSFMISDDMNRVNERNKTKENPSYLIYNLQNPFYYKKVLLSLQNKPQDILVVSGNINTLLAAQKEHIGTCLVGGTADYSNYVDVTFDEEYAISSQFQKKLIL